VPTRVSVKIGLANVTRHMSRAIWFTAQRGAAFRCGLRQKSIYLVRRVSTSLRNATTSGPYTRASNSGSRERGRMSTSLTQSWCRIFS
jgi:hypothetical protein